MFCHRLKGFMEDGISSKVLKVVDNIKGKKLQDGNKKLQDGNKKLQDGNKKFQDGNKKFQDDLDKLIKFYTYQSRKCNNTLVQNI